MAGPRSWKSQPWRHAAADTDGDALSIVAFTQPSQAVGTVTQDGNRLVFRGAARFMSVTFTYTTFSSAFRCSRLSACTGSWRRSCRAAAKVSKS